MPLIGATVLIQGTTTGVAVDLDGNFSLPQAKVGDTLEISLIGYAKQTLPVTGSAPLQVVMLEDNEVLDAVVVTALGIKRAEKSLTYNVQEVAGDIVTSVKDANFMNSLSGKVAGLQINASASGAGGSTRVVMRGVKSINGENNALYVIDGIPLPSLRSSQTEGTYETPDGGDFEGIANFNPDDIGIHVDPFGRHGFGPLRCSGCQRCDPHHHQEGQGGPRAGQLFELDDLLPSLRDAQIPEHLRHERNRADDELGQQTRHADFGTIPRISSRPDSTRPTRWAFPPAPSATRPMRRLPPSIRAVSYPTMSTTATTSRSATRRC